MRVLAIETASEACSVALIEDGALLAHDHRVLGRGHAEHLVPMIADLPGRGRAKRIHVSLGPGSFTGVRIGIAAARALGLAWGAQVLGYPTLSLLASRAPGQDVLVCVQGGHGEWFVQPFDAQGTAVKPVASMTPQAAVEVFDQKVIVGSKAQEFADLRGGDDARDMLPDARFALDLAERHLQADLAPIYGRGPDAKLPQARR